MNWTTICRAFITARRLSCSRGALLPLLLLAQQATAQVGFAPPDPEQQGLPLNWRVAPAPPVPQEKQTLAGPAIADVALLSAITRIDVEVPHHEAEIRALTAPLLGQSQLAGSTLEALRADIWNLYRQQGRLASIDIAAFARSAAEGGSVLQVQVREVQVQRVNVEVQGTGSVSEGVIESILTDVRSAVPEGSVLDLDRLDSTIKRRQFLGDANLYAILVPVGEAALDINLQVGLAEAPPTTWVAQYDNYGMSTYGRDRFTGGMAQTSAFTAGDRLSLLATGSEDMIYGRLAYEIPWAWLGGRAAGWISRVEYEAPSGVEGAVAQFGANLTYPLYFADNAIWTGYLDYTNSHQHDFIGLMEINDRRINSLQARVDTSLLASATQTVYLSLAIQQGWLDLSGLPAAEIQDERSAQSEGAFTKLDWVTSWSGIFGPAHKLDFLLKARGQFTHKNLDDSEKFTLGGPEAVRAYGSGHAMGDEGSLLNTELGYRLAAPLRLYAFYDIGQTKRHSEPWVDEIVAQRYTLQGAGLGVSYTIPEVTVAASYAQKLDDDPGREFSVDIDDMNDDYQLWLSVSSQF